MSVRTNSFFKALILDPLKPTAHEARSDFAPNDDGLPLGAPLIVAVIGLAAGIGVGFGDLDQFLFAYLVAWTACVALALGGLFFTIIQHVTKAYWSVTVRRIAEALPVVFPVLGVLALPLLFGLHEVYHWTHPELFTEGNPAFDPIIAGKRAYLNDWFFIGRMVAYFLIWSYLSFRLYMLSVRQDVDNDPSIPAQQRKTSAWGLPVFAVTVSFFSYDALMSTDPHWFSTIFGVYYFTGAFFSGIAFLILMAALLQRGGMLKEEVTIEHYHDLGKFLFAFFAAFWAYIAFSQYMLIWYAGIPEETLWYRHRLEHGWEAHSMALIFVHFVIPFLLLLPRIGKRSRAFLSIMAVWALFMNFFDMHYLVMPVYDNLYGEGHAFFSFTALALWIGMMALVTALCMYRLKRHALVPQNDPQLDRALHFENV